MASKLNISVFLACVAPNFFDFSSAASGELPAKSFDVLDQIDGHMDVIIFEEFIVVKNFANSLRNWTEQMISGRETGNASPTIFNATEALGRLKNAVDHMLTATSISAGRACATGDSFRNAAYADTESSVDSLGRAVASATAGEYPGNKDKFENYKTETQKALQSFSQNVVDLISSCLNPDNRDDVDEVIETVANGTETSLILEIEYLYNIIWIYGNVVSNKNSYDMDSALTGIDSNRVNACASIAGFLEYAIGAIQGFFLDRVLGGTNIVKILYLSQYFEKVSRNNLNNTYDPIATAIANTLERRTNVMEIGRLDYFPATLTNQSASAIGLQRATYGGLDAMKQTQPISAVKVDAVKLIFPAVSSLFATTWFGSVRLADNDGLLCSLVPAQIEVINKSQVPLIVGFVATLFITLSNNLTTAGQVIGSNVKNSAVQDAVYYGATANGFIYKGSEYLSKTICARRGATQADFYEMRHMLEETVINMIKFTKVILKSNLIQVLINHGYTVEDDDRISFQAPVAIGFNFVTAANRLRSLLCKASKSANSVIGNN